MKRLLLLICLLWLALPGHPAGAEPAGQPAALSEACARLPLGVFAVPKDLLYLARMKGFEVVHDYRFEESRGRDDELAAYLDAAQALGLKVLVGFERQADNLLSKSVARVRRFQRHPAVWAWYLADEPKLPQYDQLAELAAAIRREDAAHPLALATDEPRFASLADLVFAYTYPVYGQPFPRQDLSSWVKRLEQAAAAGSPFAVLVQTFNWNHYLHFDKRRRENRLPNLQEMRFMAFSGVRRGCRGVFFFSFQTLPVEERHLNQAVAPLLAELKGMREYLLGDRVDAQKYSAYPDAAAWRRRGRTMLLLTNPTPREVMANLKSGPWVLSDLKHPGTGISPGTVPLKPWGVRLVLVAEHPGTGGMPK
jgi:hypothetical protein